MRFYPLIKSQSVTSPDSSGGNHRQILTNMEHHISSLHSHFGVQLSAGSPFLLTDKNGKFLRFFNINMQHAVPPTNTKFKPLLLPSQAGIPHTNTHKHRTSYFKSTLIFWGLAKLWKSIYAARQKTEILAISSSSIISQLRRDFSMLHVQIFINLISIASYFPEVRAFGTLITSAEVLGLYICNTL